jgi:hypothetical protein
MRPIMSAVGNCRASAERPTWARSRPAAYVVAWPKPAGQVWRTLCPLADIHPRDSLRLRQNSLPGTVGLNLGKKTKKEPNGVLRVSVISFEGKRGKSVGRFVSTSDRSPSQRTENGSFPWVTAHRCIYAPTAYPHFCPSYF